MPWKRKVFVGPSAIHGKGLYAKGSFEKGDYIGTFEGPPAKRNGSHVLWVEREEGLVGRRGRNKLRYLNDHRAPNARFEDFDLYALRAIEPNEEITIDYGGEIEWEGVSSQSPAE